MLYKCRTICSCFIREKCYKSVGADNLGFHFCVKQRIDEEEHPTLHQVKDFIPRYVIY